MKDFGLSDIEVLRKEIKSREGLLIDYDYATVLADMEAAMDTQKNPSGGRTVSFFFDTCLHLLRYFAGYSSFHCNGVTGAWHPSPCGA